MTVNNSDDLSLKKLIQKCKQDNQPACIIEWLIDAFHTLKAKTESQVDWDLIHPVSTDDCLHQSSIEVETKEIGLKHCEKLVMIKLNGGMGTSMGCQGPKSLIKVDKYTFIDRINLQRDSFLETYHCNVPLYLLNSFYTHDTMQSLNIKADKMLLQHRVPRLCENDLSPFVSKISSDDEWTPPGHGDVFRVLFDQGELDILINQGKEYAFISNCDNLGATMSPDLLGHMVENKIPFMMEVCQRTVLDVKGGALVQLNGKFDLLERAQVLDQYIHEFEDSNRFQCFNTNNIWVHLPTLKRMMESKTFKLPLIKNTKMINGTAIIQCETAMGAAVNIIEGAQLIVVDRERFIPIKKTSDLLLLRSNIYSKQENGKIIRNKKSSHLPNISWDKEYQSVDDFNEAFECIPDLLECQSLTIRGKFKFKKDITIKGNVTLENQSGNVIVLEDMLIDNTSLKY